MQLFKSLAVASFAVTSTSAIVIPTSIPPVEDDKVASPPLNILSNADGKTVKLDCPGCPVLIGETFTGQTVWLQGSPESLHSQLELNFKIKHLKKEDVLTLNDVQIFPTLSPLESVPASLNAYQYAADATKQHRNLVPLGYSTQSQLIKPPTEKENLALYRMRVQIAEIGPHWVDGIDALDFDFLLTPSGGLMLTDIEHVPTGPIHGISKCDNFVCKLKTLLDSGLSKIPHPKVKGHKCHGMHRGNRTSSSLSHQEIGNKESHHEPHGHMSHGPHHAHGQHRSHHRFGAFFHKLKSVGLQIMIPVLVGIAAGIAASFIGMVVGHLIVLVWRVYYRGDSKADGRSIVSDDEKTGLADEKEPMLIEELEIAAPPAYSDELVDVKNPATV